MDVKGICTACGHKMGQHRSGDFACPSVSTAGCATWHWADRFTQVAGGAQVTGLIEAAERKLVHIHLPSSIVLSAAVEDWMRDMEARFNREAFDSLARLVIFGK